MSNFKHKNNCRFKGFSKSLINFDDNGPDRQLTITENGVDWDQNIHTSDKEDYFIEFNFCPCCGANRE